MSAELRLVDDTYREPPHSIDAELAVIGAIFVNNDAYNRVADIVEPQHFYDPNLARVFAAQAREIEAERLAEVRIMHDALQADGMTDEASRKIMAAAAQAAVSILDARSYAVHVRDLAVRRAAIAACGDLINALHDPNAGRNAAHSLIADRLPVLEELAECPHETPRISVVEAARRLADYVANPLPVYATGIIALDEALGGGLTAGDVYALSARPGQFKTGTMTTLAMRLARCGVRTTYITMEMGVREITQRMVAAEGRFQSQRFRHADHDGWLRGKALEFAKSMPDNVDFIDRAGLSFGQLQALCVESVRRHGSRGIWIDYYQLIGGRHPSQSVAAHLEEIATWAQGFCKRHAVFVFFASQTNRGGEMLGGDGLFRNSSWYGELNKVPNCGRGAVEGIWIDVRKGRHVRASACGSEDAPAMWIDARGPRLRDWNDYP